MGTIWYLLTWKKDPLNKFRYLKMCAAELSVCMVSQNAWGRQGIYWGRGNTTLLLGKQGFYWKGTGVALWVTSFCPLLTSFYQIRVVSGTWNSYPYIFMMRREKRCLGLSPCLRYLGRRWGWTKLESHSHPQSPWPVNWLVPLPQ